VDADRRKPAGSSAGAAKGEPGHSAEERTDGMDINYDLMICEHLFKRLCSEAANLEQLKFAKNLLPQHAQIASTRFQELFQNNNFSEVNQIDEHYQNQFKPRIQQELMDETKLLINQGFGRKANADIQVPAFLERHYLNVVFDKIEQTVLGTSTRSSPCPERTAGGSSLT